MAFLIPGKVVRGAAIPRGTERLAISLAFVGMAGALLRALAWPWLPKLVPVALIVTALGLLLIGIVRRAGWHATFLSGGGVADGEDHTEQRDQP